MSGRGGPGESLGLPVMLRLLPQEGDEGFHDERTWRSWTKRRGPSLPDKGHEAARSIDFHLADGNSSCVSMISWYACECQ
jgi:hypothetical protein